MTTPSSNYARCVQVCRDAMPDFELRLLARTPSTQDRVREAARGGAAAGYCVVAAEQTAGRGRQGRSWVAPPGTALLMSLLVDAGAHPGPIPLAAGLAVADAVAEYGVETTLKWPNDVLVEGRKLAGILAEMVPSGVVLGIGVNVSVERFPDSIPGASLEALSGKQVAWDELLEKLVPALQRRLRALDQGGVAAIATDWKARATGLGAEVVASTPNGEIRGEAIGLDTDGALIIATAQGRVRLLAGDVHIVG